jgi:ABC-type lipoprotein release transport system permease subunit
MSALLQDIRLALRTLAKNAGFALASYIPGRRAASVDPVRVLNAD